MVQIMHTNRRNHVALDAGSTTLANQLASNGVKHDADGTG
jgi:hypothetical protein